MINATAVCQRRMNNPCATLAQIGIEFDITRERVRQILAEHNLPTSHYIQRTFICNQCGKEYYRLGSPCDTQLFCSLQCKHNYYRSPTLICEVCGKPFQRLIAEIRAAINRNGLRHVFCSRQCMGKWFGKNYGFGIFPEHRVHIHKHKWNWDKVIELRQQTGWGVWRLGRALGIPQSTVHSILTKGGHSSQTTIDTTIIDTGQERC